MDPATLKEKLIAVLGQIQADSGLDCPPLTGATKPAENIPKFDSKVWPVATTILATEIGAHDPERREHLRRRGDQAAALDRRDRGLRVRTTEEAGRDGSGHGMSDTESAKRSLIAERLKEARKLAGLSQGHVAKILDLHRPSVSEMEAGNRRVSADELARLAEIYDVSVAWLLGEAPETLDAQDPRLELAARELTKLKPDDLDRLLKLLAAMRSDSTPNAGGGDR